MCSMVGRYVGVGVLVASADYAVFAVVMLVGASALSANFFSRLAATLIGAWLHRTYTFAGPQRLGVARQMVAFGVLSAGNLLLSSALIFILHTRLGWPPIWAKLGTDVIIVIISLAVSRLLIFAPTR